MTKYRVFMEFVQGKDIEAENKEQAIEKFIEGLLDDNEDIKQACKNHTFVYDLEKRLKDA